MGADVAIEALGLQVTFENALRCLRPGGTLSSLVFTSVNFRFRTLMRTVELALAITRS